MRVIVKKLSTDAQIPEYQTEGAANFDLHSVQDFLLWPNQRQAIKTGLAMEIPKGFVGEIYPRSGLALKNGVTVLNAPGQIDSDYRNEIMVILINTGDNLFEVKKGDRIAQMRIEPVTRAAFTETTGDLTETNRVGGFGSTGV